MTTADFSVSEIHDFKQKMLNWANRFNIFCLLDNNGYDEPAPAFDLLLAAGAARSITLTAGNAFTQLRTFAARPSWIFGHLAYELRHDIEEPGSTHEIPVDFGIGFFFEPLVLIRCSGEQIQISTSEQLPASVFEAIISQNISGQTHATPVVLQPLMSKEEYLQAISAIKNDIRCGECYELNFCQQFLAANAVINPTEMYTRLCHKSANPFGAFYKLFDKYCMCASPERYLRRRGAEIISQPIKGTAKRAPHDAAEDEQNKCALAASAKNRSENVMIVDLVRNDLSKVCEEGTVQVQELFGIHSFPQVHQMISTVRGRFKPGLSWVDAVQASFPMGSMTGAPKKRVMQLINAYEKQGRGLFSGSIGYITPAGDFDFNVVIRSLFYDSAKQLLSCAAGGGITFYSDAEEEYAESMLKAAAMMEVLQQEEEKD